MNCYSDTPLSKFLTPLKLFVSLKAESFWRWRNRENYLILGGHIYFQTLSAAVQLDLFSLLDEKGPLTEEEVAQALNLEKQPCTILLLGLTALKLLVKKSGHYKNSKFARAVYSRCSAKNMIDIVKWQHFINYKPMYHFYESLRANTNTGLKDIPGGDEPYLYGRLTHHPELEKIFQDAMHEISLRASENFATYVDLSASRFLIDVGGGDGTNIINLAKANPELRAAVFDSKTVCKIAEKNIAEKGFSSRLGAIQGDCFTTPFPQEADTILFCHFFTIWSLEENLQILKKAYDSLPSGGRAIIFNMMQHNDHTGPILAAMGSPYFLTLATGKGMLYTWDQYIERFKAAGFKDIKTQRLPSDHGVIIGTKP
ncbi:MAG: methyltransferase domain-containing protein [Rhodospirillales bacterium]|nr:methyltransferase domain-containing protein [Rhodospirillales bacterium]